MEHPYFVVASLSFGFAGGFALGRRTLPPYTEVS